MARHHLRHRGISRQVYQFSQIPAKSSRCDVAKICIGAFIICSLAALFPPGYRAARLDPVKALSYTNPGEP